MALPRPVLPGVAGRLRRRPRRAVRARPTSSKLCRDFYAGIGLPIDDVLARSDLYEKTGKSPHAFCTDIDREGDVRVLANIVPNEYWMGDDAPRARPRGLQQQEHPADAALRPARRGAHPDHRGRGDDVRAVQQGRATGWRRWASTVDDPKAFDATGGEDAAQPAADLLALVPGDAAVREGDVREPGPGPEQAVVGPGREVPAGSSGPTAATPRTTPARSTSSAPRSTTTTT